MSKQQKIKNTNIRLNMMNPEDQQAWAYLQNLDRKQYKSYSRAVVIALNDYFRRQERLADDPYLENRNKEDAFLQKVLSSIEKGVRESISMGMSRNMLQFFQPFMAQQGNLAQSNPIPSFSSTTGNAGEAQIDQQEREEAENAALDFADSF